MRKDILLPSQPKGVYRVTNWPEYNAGLVERGDVTLWMDEQMFAPASQTPGQRWRPQAYCDGMIQMLLTLKSVYRLPLRALQGPVLRNAGEAVHLLVDSTGLKLFGEGEWKVRRHGYAKRRSWR